MVPTLFFRYCFVVWKEISMRRREHPSIKYRYYLEAVLSEDCVTYLVFTYLVYIGWGLKQQKKDVTLLQDVPLYRAQQKLSLIFNLFALE